jgi:hypothetical protein
MTCGFAVKNNGKHMIQENHTKCTVCGVDPNNKEEE